MTSEAPAASERSLSERDLRRSAFECESLEVAAEKLGVADLPGLLAAKTKLAAAWERGRFLREVLRVAKLGIVAGQADKYFTEQWHLQRGDLAEKLKRDRALLDVWTAGQSEARLKARAGIMERVNRGEADAKVMELYERLLLDRDGDAEARARDFEDLTPTQLEAATGIKRAQWLRWWKDSRLPRKGSGRYALPAVVAWLREHEATGGVKLEQGLNPLSAEKVRRLRLENDEAEDRLWDRGRIAAMFTERAARMVQVLSAARAKEWACAHEGKTAAQLEAEYLRAFQALRLLWKEFPAEIPLPPAARAKIEEGLTMLMKDETADEH